MNHQFLMHGVRVLGAIFAMNFAFQAMKKGGSKSTIFGPRITRTVGELHLRSTGAITTTLNLHCLETRGRGAPTVRLEVVNHSVASYRRIPIRLTSEQAFVRREFLS
jgi:hypothetical protein